MELFKKADAECLEVNPAADVFEVELKGSLSPRSCPHPRGSGGLGLSPRASPRLPAIVFSFFQALKMSRVY